MARKTSSRGSIAASPPSRKSSVEHGASSLVGVLAPTRRGSRQPRRSGAAESFNLADRFSVKRQSTASSSQDESKSSWKSEALLLSSLAMRAAMADREVCGLKSTDAVQFDFWSIIFALNPGA
jgi:hypothetical protein